MRSALRQRTALVLIVPAVCGDIPKVIQGHSRSADGVVGLLAAVVAAGGASVAETTTTITWFPSSTHDELAPGL